MNTSQLIQDLASEDVDTRCTAFWLLADSFRPELQKVAETFRASLANHTRDGLTATDIVSMALARIATGRMAGKPWDLREDGDDWKRPFLGYIKTAVENLAIDRIKIGQRRSVIQGQIQIEPSLSTDGNDVPAPSAKPQYNGPGFNAISQTRRWEEDERHIREALSKLKPLDAKTHELLIYRYVERMTYADIARLELPETASQAEVDATASALRKRDLRADIPEPLRYLMERFQKGIVG